MSVIQGIIIVTLTPPVVTLPKVISVPVTTVSLQMVSYVRISMSLISEIVTVMLTPAVRIVLDHQFEIALTFWFIQIMPEDILANATPDIREPVSNVKISMNALRLTPVLRMLTVITVSEPGMSALVLLSASMTTAT